MARLIWTEPALQDLDAIADYIALDKPAAARKFVRRVFAKVEKLRTFPRIGPRSALRLCGPWRLCVETSGIGISRTRFHAETPRTAKHVKSCRALGVPCHKLWNLINNTTEDAGVCFAGNTASARPLLIDFTTTEA